MPATLNKKSLRVPKRLSESLFASLIETAIIHNKLNIEELTTISFDKLKKILLETLNGCTNEIGDLRSTVLYTDDIVKEADLLNRRGKTRLALTLYATAIEHSLNDIINKSLLTKNLDPKDIESILKLDITSKTTWLLPLLGLPKLSNNCSKNIKMIADKRNEFVHYKFKGKFDNERDCDEEQYKNLCLNAKSVISLLKRYNTNNLISTNKIKKILKNLGQ